MADYGLNTVRIPIPYWVYNVTDDEPYITQRQIPYLQRALNWSSLYGMDVMMDLHAVPGACRPYIIHLTLLTSAAKQDPSRVTKCIPVTMLRNPSTLTPPISTVRWTHWPNLSMNSRRTSITAL